MDSDLLAVTILDVLERERINPFPIIYNVTNRAGLGSDDMQCTMHVLSAGTPRLAAHEDFCQIGVFVQNNGLVVTGETGL